MEKESIIQRISLVDFLKLNLKNYSHIKKECSDNSYRFDYIKVNLNDEVLKSLQESKDDKDFTGKIVLFIHKLPDKLESRIETRKEWMNSICKDPEILDIWTRNSIISSSGTYYDKYYTNSMRKCFLLFDSDILDVKIKRNNILLIGQKYETLEIPLCETEVVYLINCEGFDCVSP